MNFSVESRDIFALVVVVATLPMSAVCQFWALGSRRSGRGPGVEQAAGGYLLR